MTHTVTARAPVRPRYHLRDELSFSKRHGRGAAGRRAHDLWVVQSTGNYILDNRVGNEMAREIVAFLADTRDVCILSDIAFELMDRGRDAAGPGIVVGFYAELAMELLRAARPEGRP